MIVLLIFIAVGLICSSEFRNGAGTMIGSIIVFTPLIIIGTPYALFIHSPYMAIKKRSFKLLVFYWLRLIDGVYASLGDMMKYGIAYRYDELANVTGGEMFEDLIGTEEGTVLGEKQTTVSASIGYYKVKGFWMNGFGIGLDKALNFVFRQTRHAVGSWERKIAIQELDDKNLLGNK